MNELLLTTEEIETIVDIEFDEDPWECGITVGFAVAEAQLKKVLDIQKVEFYDGIIKGE